MWYTRNMSNPNTVPKSQFVEVVARAFFDKRYEELMDQLQKEQETLEKSLEKMSVVDLARYDRALAEPSAVVQLTYYRMLYKKAGVK